MLHRLKGGGFRLRLKAGLVRLAADSGQMEVVVRFRRGLVFDVFGSYPIDDIAPATTQAAQATAALAQDRRRPMPPKGVGFPDPLSGTLKCVPKRRRVQQ